ncbi:MAG: hypothetical protein IJ174_08370 [Clostridia bacterium]|nr:hypothetical protein [Clostridia bacterium]
MKHPNARRILCAVMILLLMAGLFAVLGFIGRRTDLSYAKELCSQRIDGVASSVSDLIGTYTRVFYNYENVLRTNAALSALPLEETLREQGDGAIRMYRNGCIVRLDGDELIILKTCRCQ